jgi:CspA family cold shock protein
MFDNAKRERGRVLWFNNAKGTGRICSDEHGDIVWVHFAQISIDGFKSLSEGQIVEYTRVVGPGPHGDRAIAYDVVPVPGSQEGGAL